MRRDEAIEDWVAPGGRAGTNLVGLLCYLRVRRCLVLVVLRRVAGELSGATAERI